MKTLVRFACIALLVACGGKARSTAVPHDHGEGGHDDAIAGSASSDDEHVDDHRQDVDEHTTASSGSPAGQEHHHDHDVAGSGSGDAERTEPVGSPQPPAADGAKVKARLLAAEIAAYEKAKPVFEANCARCHSKTGNKSTEKKRSHFDMTTYPFGGHHAATIAAEICESLGLTGEKPTMPFDKKGSVKGDDLALIAAWARAFDEAKAGGAHEGTEHEHEHAPDHHHEH